MPQYKLIYFNGRGRAENIRMVFEHAGIKYEDVRLDAEAWKEYKPKSPFGQMPVLEIDGVPFAQSNAILRYVGREAGLDGGSSINVLKVDMILDSIEDVGKEVMKWFAEADPEKKEQLFKKVSEETVPRIVGKFEEIIKKNNTGFSVGSSLTIADIALAKSLSSLQERLKDFDAKKYPSVLALQTKVHSLPKIKSWIERRPVTPF